MPPHTRRDPYPALPAPGGCPGFYAYGIASLASLLHIRRRALRALALIDNCCACGESPQESPPRTVGVRKRW
jgi:hypothetical protein